jgi:uncharacterized protein (DUF1778 family)
VSVRIPAEEREIIEAVAHYMGESLSNFIRRTAVTVAQGIVDKHSWDKVVAPYRATVARHDQREATVLEGMEAELTRQRAASAASRERQD